MYYFQTQDPRYFVQIYGYDPSKLTLLMRYYPNGSLTAFLQSTNQVSKNQRMILLIDIASALKIMHTEGFAHCDLKSDNVLLAVRGNQPRAVLTDLGISKIVDQERVLKPKGLLHEAIQGFSVKYAAPEIMRAFRQRSQAPSNDNSVDQKAADVFSFGCLVYEFLCAKRPWFN